MTTSADDVTPETDDIPSRKPRVRMSGSQRREQLVAVGRKLFAAKGYEAVSVEEIAAKAEVSKPVVYEHFGGKEGLYAVIVDREVTGLIETIMDALSSPSHPRRMLESAALGMLTYIENSTDGFRILVRDSPPGTVPGSFCKHHPRHRREGRGQVGLRIRVTRLLQETGSYVRPDVGGHGEFDRPMVGRRS